MGLLSTRCVYGLRAALYVAGCQQDRPCVMIREISDELAISFHFLTKILQQLTAAGIMRSTRGRKGGITLAKPAHRISLLDVIECLDGKAAFGSCVLGLTGCSDRKPCPLHAAWAAKRKTMQTVFARTTLAALGRQVRRKGIRLTD